MLGRPPGCAQGGWMRVWCIVFGERIVKDIADDQNTSKSILPTVMLGCGPRGPSSVSPMKTRVLYEWRAQICGTRTKTKDQTNKFKYSDWCESSTRCEHRRPRCAVHTRMSLAGAQDFGNIYPRETRRHTYTQTWLIPTRGDGGRAHTQKQNHMRDTKFRRARHFFL